MFVKWFIIIIDTPLHMASGDAVGTHLLNFGADAFLTNKRGLTPIETAKQQGRTSLVRMFQKAQEQAHRNMLAKERERRAIIRARHKEMEIEDRVQRPPVHDRQICIKGFPFGIDGGFAGSDVDL